MSVLEATKVLNLNNSPMLGTGDQGGGLTSRTIFLDKFPKKGEEAMLIDTDPFPSNLEVNMVTANLRNHPQLKVDLGRSNQGKGSEFVLEAKYQLTFDRFKKYMMRSPVLMPLIEGRPLKLYMAASSESVGSLLTLDDVIWKEHVVYYLIQTLLDTDRQYSAIEKLYLSLYFAATKLRHYLLVERLNIITVTDLVKYMLNWPIINGRIGKWVLALFEFDLCYIPQKAVKGRAIANFLADHPSDLVEQIPLEILDLYYVQLTPWKLIFDRSRTHTASGVGIILIAPNGNGQEFAFQLEFNCTNNQAEYEAMIVSLKLLVELGARIMIVISDSQLVINQMAGLFKCSSITLLPYYALATQMLDQFEEVELLHVTREHNMDANEIAQLSRELDA
ncbi:uncharacterized protein LOC131254179 [Magnolia sinica]|uniref:uncharacterized protein LOC131254179 n=1 Tax=Magnolia sinica TaxID=86752 RepID=UPI00265A7379|nr:uncharacterized protein LOC131254179 [Magnolia sinica]